MEADGGAHARVLLLEDRLRILSGALRAFAEATTDYLHLLDVVAQTVSEVVKDGCVVRLLAKDGWLEPVAVHLPIGHVRDPDQVARVRAHAASPHHVGEHGGARLVIETGDAVLVPHLDLNALRASAAPEIVDAYETIGLHSLLLVALRVRGESIGILSLSRFAPGSQPFDDHDRHLAQALADHAALAITNARMLHNLEELVAERTAELKVLRGMLPICAWCRRIRDDRGAWAPFEAYVAAHTDAVVTHGICPECSISMLK